MTCKNCKYFIQGEGHYGTCQKKPYVSTRRGGIQMINSKPRVLVVGWSHVACKLFAERGDTK